MKKKFVQGVSFNNSLGYLQDVMLAYDEEADTFSMSFFRTNNIMMAVEAERVREMINNKTCKNCKHYALDFNEPPCNECCHNQEDFWEKENEATL